ncbi:uncharacterized protein B0T15DRAFT_298429 [Chaetomium strumarium]|uniref:Secreted protein n=1 Tax=Chaetomium strumarium TaxID=1170767 RepID=A0AAJ0GLP6_9PEZI|nr:hypothetical protein B0T15DRAFT_298429 [Chaetomium strumarium]
MYVCTGVKLVLACGLLPLLVYIQSPGTCRVDQYVPVRHTSARHRCIYSRRADAQPGPSRPRPEDPGQSRRSRWESSSTSE